METRDPSTLNRRTFLQLLGASGLSTLGACASSNPTAAPVITGKAQQRIVVVGGGFGGATAAKYLRKFLPDADITLVEYQKYYTTGPASNWVLGGLRHVDAITFDYKSLGQQHGVKVIRGWVTTVDTEGRNVRLTDGSRIPYDRLVLSPGIDLKFESVDGYDEMDVNQVPHGWKPGTQTAVLRQQLTTMRDGGTFVISAPAGHQRYPVGVYERVSMVAHYLKSQKPKSKILLLDAKNVLPSMDLFIQGWKSLYGYGTDDSMIELTAAPDGVLQRVDVRSRTAYMGRNEDALSADVLNVIPPQKAGAIARAASVTDDSGWCPVNQKTWESEKIPGIHIIGDAAIAGPMPKSAFAANSQAKACAAAIAASLLGQALPEPSLASTNYSLIGANYGVSTTSVFRVSEQQFIETVDGAGGRTPKDGDFAAEARYAENGWYNLTEDVFG